MPKTIICMVPRKENAELVLNRLQDAGFLSRDISVLFADSGRMKKFVHEKHTKAPEGAAAGAGTGGIIGGILGWLAGIGSLAIPGVGPFIAAGPIMAALGGATIGGAVGGLVGALAGLGVPEIEAKRYESKLKAGDVLLAVHTENKDEAKRAKEILKDAHAEHIIESEEVEEMASQRTPSPTVSKDETISRY